MNIIKKNIPIFIIILFHIIGLIGFIWAPELFKKLSPVNLLLSAVLILFTSKQTHIKFYGSMIAIAFLGFFIEVIGVKTGFIFGSYYYGAAMGIKILAVPLLIMTVSTEKLSSSPIDTIPKAFWNRGICCTSGIGR